LDGFHGKCPGQADVVHCRNAQIQWEPEKMKAKLCSSAANFLFNVLLTSTGFHGKARIFFEPFSRFMQKPRRLLFRITAIPKEPK
jgi:hypothetical protein